MIKKFLILCIFTFANMYAQSGAPDAAYYLREYLGYTRTDSMSVACITAMHENTTTDSSRWTQVFTPSDSTKAGQQKIIFYLAIAIGDSNSGFQLMILNTTGTTKKIIMTVHNLVGTAVLSMNFVGTPIILQANERLYARHIVPSKSSYQWYTGSGANGKNQDLWITVKYRYR